MAFHRSAALQKAVDEGELALLVRLRQAEIPKLAKDTYVNSRKGSLHWQDTLLAADQPDRKADDT